MKKGSIELSINFLVVIIISLILMGVGIWLLTHFGEVAYKWNKNVEERYKEQLTTLLDDGALVAVIPSSQTVNRGEMAEFNLAIGNELGSEQVFSVYIKKTNNIGGKELGLLYERKFTIKNNERDYTRIGITVPKGAASGTHIYNIYVCKAPTCYETPSYTDLYTDKYGDLQKVQVNVR